MARLSKNAPAKTSAPSVVEAVKETVAVEWNVTDCKARAVAAFVAEGHKASAVKKLAVYLKPEEGKAYYVINDSENGSISL